MTDKIHMEDIENGSIKISNEVIAGIAGMASGKVEGVVGMSGNLAGGITELLGKKNPAKGIKVEIRDDGVYLEMHLMLCYGSKLNEVGLEVQKKVKEAIESMTDLTVREVNVFIEGIGKTKTDKETPETK
ncbi:Asp23/Gls24 family envelope stress response protein [Gudongella oleilytica]|jgi:uncharacterized alkaline shock family protein YloU|uniref:Asp23/Gls24 family envelope stress response protein n=1 Tax=Gudongella oleilytica TaxID=1582259 RepID=UPI002A36937F|nr:Asp23/Gls24 family envelope stress response protein [Gudongella oleilytica]MDY0255745.1 Asp23/Gls24 family envelope stress response protein [Gudongella oleilytica]